MSAAATPTRRREASALRHAVLAAAAALWCAGSAAQSAARVADLDERLDNLEARVVQAESIRAIKRLQHAYGQYAELGLWHDLADLFSKDAVGHYPAGDLVGKDAIAKLFFDQVGQGRLGLAAGRLYPHIVLQPVVTLDPDGRHAHGRWHVFAMLGGLGANASWVGGVYENDYVLENGRWKISELRYFTQFSGAYETGWTNPRVPIGSEPNAGGTPSSSAGVPAAPAAPKICENYLLNACTIPIHYDVTGAGTPAPMPAPVERRRGAADQDLAELRARSADLERRAARLADESAVANLQHAYGYYADRKLWDDVADLFAADAMLELGLQGVYAGRASVRRALEQFGAQGLREGELNDRLQLQTIVTVAPDGASANARGVELAQWGANVEGEYRAEWREAIFDNTYAKENGVWKVAAMHLYPRLATDYALGWAKDARAAPVPSKEFPPDRPPTVLHGVYPEFYIPPFRFANPATAKPPQYPEGTAGAILVDVEPADARAGGGAIRGARALAALETRVGETQRVVAAALAYDGAENVANAYSYYLDEFRWDDAADLFAVNGWKELPYVGIYQGRERIRASMKMLYPAGGRPAGFFAIHQTMQPVIHVAPDGASARIRLRVLQPRGRVGAEGSWVAGVYESEAVLENGVWKLSAMDLDYTWAAGYREGWAGATRAGAADSPAAAAEGRELSAAADGLLPDLPLRGPADAPFPQIVDLPFHYDNPVSGRPRALGSRR